MFANPSGLWLLTLWLPLTVLLSYTRKYPRYRVSGLWLWPVQQMNRPRTRSWRLPPRDSWPWYIAFGCLALAAAEPNFLASPVPAPKAVFVIDTSASMSTQEAGGTRLALAKQRIETWLNRALPGTEVLLIPTHASQSASALFLRDGEPLRAIVNALQPTALHTRLQDAVTVATTRLREQTGAGEVIIITDGALADDSPLFIDATPHQIWQLGQWQANCAIVRAVITPVTPSENGSRQVAVSMVLMNFGPEPLHSHVSLRHHNATTELARQEVRLEPQQETTVTLRFEAAPSDAGTGIVAALNTRDAMRVDDTAYLVIPQLGLRTVALPDSDKLSWLERALKADPEVRSLRVSAPGEAPAGALLVFVNECPLFVPAQDYLVINPPPGECLSLSVGAEVNNPVLTKWSEADPRFRYVNPSELRLARSRPLSGNGFGPLLEAREGTIMAHLEERGYVGTVLGFGLDDSDWPSRPSFVIFIRNLVHHARSHEYPKWSPGEGASDYSLSLPEHVQAVRLLFPNGERRDLTSSEVELTVAEYGQPGFYHLSWRGPRAGSGLLGVNVLHSAESNPMIASPMVVVGDERTKKRNLPPRLLSATLVVFALLAMARPLSRMRQSPSARGYDA